MKLLKNKITQIILSREIISNEKTILVSNNLLKWYIICLLKKNSKIIYFKMKILKKLNTIISKKVKINLHNKLMKMKIKQKIYTKLKYLMHLILLSIIQITKIQQIHKNKRLKITLIKMDKIENKILTKNPMNNNPMI